MAKKLLFFPFLFLFFVTHLQAVAQDCTEFTENTSVSISTEQNRTICDGDALTFSSILSNYSGDDLTYQWTLGGNAVSGAEHGTLTHQFSSTDNGKKIRLVITSTCNTSVKRYSNELTITVNTNRKPTVAVSANKTSICPSETVSFTATNTYGGDNPHYTWYINSEATPAQEGSSNTFSTTGLDQSSNTVKVVMTSSLACVTSSTAEATSNSISLKSGTPGQPGTISLPALVCPGVDYTYSVAAVTDATSYLWTLPDNSNQTTSGPNLDLAIATAGEHSLSVQAVNECGTSTKQTTTISVNAGIPAQPGNISIPDLVCPGVENSYSFSAIADADEYIWTLHDNSTVNTSEPSLPITFNTQGSFSISVRASNECGDSANKTFSVTVNAGAPATPTAISGERIICPGTSNFTYTIPAVDFADSYEWIPSGNVSIDGTATGMSVSVSSGSTGTGSLKVRAINECGESLYTEEFQIEVYTGQPDAVSITTTHVDSPNFCPGEEIVFSVPADSKADSYTWTVPQGWSFTVGATPNEITATAGNLNDDGDITVTINNDHCGSVSDSFAVGIQNPAPQMGDITIEGPTTVCHEDQGLVYSIPAIEYATDYTWNVPADWNITSTPPHSNQITVSAGKENGEITVSTGNHCGSSVETISLEISSVDNVPAMPAEITSSLWDSATNSNDPICPPASGITFSVPNATDADSYNWILPTGWEITSGKNTSSITVKVTATANYEPNESIEVEAVNICGNSTAQIYSDIVLSDYVQVDAGEDKTVCRTTNDITINGSVNFNGSKMKIYASSTGTGSFIGIPNGKIDTYSIKYKPSQQDIDNLEQVVITVTTEAPVGACGPGEDEMIIFFRDNPAISISGDATICSGTSSPLTFTGSPNTQVTFTVNGGTNQNITIGPSGEAILDSGVLTQNTTYDLVSAVYTDAPACLGNITGSATIKVTQIPTAEISYADACTSETELDVTLTGTNNYTGGTFSGPSELSIDPSSGRINPSTSTPGTHTVTYIIPTSGGCEEIDVTTQVNILEEVVITSEPSAARACEGGAVQFEVTATGGGLSYQWYKNSAASGNEVGSNSNVLDLSNISASDAGDYLVVISGTAPCSAVTSQSAALSVDENIVVNTQPETISVCEDGAANLSVSATSGGVALGSEYSYQWFKGSPGSGTAVSGATSASLDINPATLGDSGDYYVEISGPAEYQCESVLSEAATLTVRKTPVVEISGDAEICSGNSTDITFSNGIPNGIVTYTLNDNNTAPQTFTLDANGAGTLNTGALAATSGTDTDYVYSIQSIAYPDDPTCSKAVSGSVTITVAPDPAVTMSFTEDQTEFCTADATPYTPVLEGTGTFEGGTFSATGLSINSSTGAFTPQGQTPGDYVITYTIPAYGGCPEETINLPISIYEEVKITAEPFNVGICSTQDAEFSITATGDDLKYQWFKDGNPISGAESATLSLPVATSEDAGEYFVRVSGTNACTPTEDSMVDSDIVTLNVDEDIVILEPAEDVSVCETGDETVKFKFVAHANGAPLKFTWIYSNGQPVPIDGTKIIASPVKDTIYGNLDFPAYTGTLTIKNIVEADENMYAVEIDGSDNNFTCPMATSNAFKLEVDPLPDAPLVENIEYCLNEDAVALNATGTNLLWYDSLEDKTPSETAPVPPTNAVGEYTYYVSQTPLYCESELATITVTINDRPSAPALTAEESNLEYCLGETATALTATPDTDAALNWYESANSTTPLDAAPVPPTTAAGTLQYWVSQTNAEGCEGDRAVVTITINQLPTIVPPADTTICSGDTIEVTASDTNAADETTMFSWDWATNTGEPKTGSSIPLSPAETTTYTITATNSKGCVNTKEFTISVDDRPVGGSIDGPASVCITDPSGTLTLIDSAGSIDRWEYLTGSATEWTSIANITTSLDFSSLGLSEDTRFRAVLTNGVCEEVYSDEHLLVIDPEPLAGGLLFKGTDRVFMMCELPTNDYLVPLQAVGTYTGQIVAWHYRRNSATDWATVKNADGSNFTGDFLSGEQVIKASNNESTIFQVEVQSGACEPNVYSETATLSIIPSDIAPNPVTASPGEICLGDIVTLNAGTGYGGYGVFQGGAFDNSSIANHGWRVMRLDNNTEYTFESAADNTRPDRWMRTNPHEYTMADPDKPGSTIYQLFDSSSGDEGNKGFAIVSGNNPSTLETPVFNLYATDDPVLTFDQAYNLTPGDTIKVQISLDGGNTYVDEPLFVMGGPNVSENYASFGDGDLESRPLNKMSIDMSKYAGMGNLRIRWLYDGSTGGIYTIDDIGIPQDPDNVQLIWYYDDDLDDPNNDLEQIGEVNQSTVTYTPTKIGWNYFEVQTALVFDTNGDPCQSAENMATIQVYVFDTYTTSATAEIGSCGTSSVPLSGVMEGAAQGVITEFPAEDESTIAWEVIESPEGYTFSEAHFDPSITDPNAIFDPGMGGEFTLQWTITPDEDSPCSPTQNPVQFEIQDCTTLDFDGVDDYVDLGTSYTGSYTIEAWIRPFDRPIEGTEQMTDASYGTIISGPSYEVNMSELPASVVPGTRWYHIAITPDRKLYVDGILISGASLSGGHGKQGTFIGANNNSAGEMINHFSGWIEEVRIWNKGLSQNQIKFMMNQRLINNGAEMGEQIPMPVPEGLTYSDLAGYYRLISKDPDPANLVSFDATLMPSFGETPDLAINPVPGRLYNMTTNQQNTAPLPYISAKDATDPENEQSWYTPETWIRPDVWDPPNSRGVDGTLINWNIAIIKHNIHSGEIGDNRATRPVDISHPDYEKDLNLYYKEYALTLLGLKSESGLLTMASPGTYDENNDGEALRVTHYLLLNGNIDLVGESQLLQDEGSILAEESAGWLERDQQGKMLSFNYNYWSSPVSAQGAANNADYSVSQVLMDGTDSKNPKSIKFDDRYHAADGNRQNPIIISNYWIWKFLGTADFYEEWFHIGSTGTLATGEGYTMKGTDGTVGINAQQNYVFKGKPHNGDFTREVSQNQNYLVGNPYPSAIDAKEFILDNMKNVTYEGESGRNTLNIFNGALYYWDHFSGRTHYLEEYIGGYATWTLAGGVVAISSDERINATNDKGTKEPGQYIPVAQGFFVNTVLDDGLAAVSGITVSGGDIQFKNRQRVYEREEGNSESIFHSQEKKETKSTTSEFSKQASEDTRQKIWLKFSSPMGYHRQLLVTADPNTSSGFDLGYDAPMIEDNEEDMYWYFSNYEFVIQAVEDFNVDRELDLGIKVHEEGKITIAIDDLKNIPDDLEIFLKDSLLQVNHDLRKTAYKATSDTGTFHNRFKVIFKDPTAIDVEEPEVEVPEEGEFEILYVTGSREILVKNPELLDIERIYLNNMLGQQLHVYYDVPAEKELRLPVRRFSSGVYIVKVHSEKGIRTKKVILE